MLGNQENKPAFLSDRQVEPAVRTLLKKFPQYDIKASQVCCIVRRSRYTLHVWISTSFQTCSLSVAIWSVLYICRHMHAHTHTHAQKLFVSKFIFCPFKKYLIIQNLLDSLLLPEKIKKLQRINISKKSNKTRTYTQI